jgi:hypothetical protein
LRKALDEAVAHIRDLNLRLLKAKEMTAQLVQDRDQAGIAARYRSPVRDSHILRAREYIAQHWKRAELLEVETETGNIRYKACQCPYCTLLVPLAQMQTSSERVGDASQ